MTTAQDLIKKEIVKKYINWTGEKEPEDYVYFYDCKTDEDKWYFQDEAEEIRQSGQSCNLSCEEFSRHYECDQVVYQIDDMWVSWVYWYGGGKHSEPQAIDWITDAFICDVEEEEVIEIKRTFTKKG